MLSGGGGGNLMGSVEILSENMSDKVAKNILRGRDRMVRQKKKNQP